MPLREREKMHVPGEYALALLCPSELSPEGQRAETFQLFSGKGPLCVVLVMCSPVEGGAPPIGYCN